VGLSLVVAGSEPSTSTFSHPLRINAQGDVDRRFPGLLDSILTAGAAARPA
jgi:hypothetical protein